MPSLQYLKQKKAQLAALGEWTHINCLKQNAREAVQDDILSQMLYVRPSSKPPPAASQSRLERLLDAIDLETVMAKSAPDPTVDVVPGGTVSFLFERGSQAVVDDDEEQPDDTT